MGRFFSTESEVYAHFKPFFERLLQDEEVGSHLREKRMSFRFITKDPSAEIALDAHEGEGEVRTGSGTGDEDVLINLRADLLHQLMLGKIRLMPAIMGRQISARGVMDKQKELGAMIATLSERYRAYLEEQKKQDMLV